MLQANRRHDGRGIQPKNHDMVLVFQVIEMSRIRSGRRNDKERLEEEGDDDNSSHIPSEVVAYSKWSGPFTWTSIIQGAVVGL
jgi:hypothetical protein